MRAIVAIACLSISATASAQEIEGSATATDGDSLTMTGTRIRLFGVDAPEAEQTCRRDDADWNCGKDAAAYLASLVDGKSVRCIHRDRDRYGRIVAQCAVAGLDLADLMVRSGFALALPQFTEDYVAAEATAKRLRLGVWSATFDTPAAWRSAHSKSEPLQAPAPDTAERRIPPRVYRDAQGCMIKGNRNRKGQWIYHLPGMPYYVQTRAEELFCTEAQATAAGYRRAIVRP